MLLHAGVLFIAALLAGSLNSVAGGGSFVTFPALIFTGVPPIIANATNTVALWPGTLASVGAYRREVGSAPHRLLLSAASLAGGGVGALLLLHTPPAAFTRLIPYLLLVATALFAFSGPVTTLLRSRAGLGTAASPRVLAGLALAQFVIATYGGFFGGGIGILMLATLGLMGLTDIHVMNGLKTLLASLINGVAVVIFVIAGAVVWPQALVMVVAAIIGGYAGAAGARRVRPRLVRIVVIVVGCAMTAYFFARG